MKKQQRQVIVDLLKACRPEVIQQAASLCDGHSILKPHAFTDTGLPAAVVKYMTMKYRSDDSPKGTIFVRGQPVNELRGVYGLHMLRFLADALSIEYRCAMGRGREARNIQAAIKRHFDRILSTCAASET